MKEIIWDVRKELAVIDSVQMTEIERILSDSGHQIMKETFHIFSNGAITKAYILAESHFVYHAWPETGMIYFDLFSCREMAESEFVAVARRISDAVGGEIVRMSVLERISDEDSLRPNVPLPEGDPS